MSILEDQNPEKSHELDLTSHQEYIINGIQNIRKIYRFTSNDAKNAIEKAYADRISKVPKVIPYYQDINNTIKSFIIYINRSKGKSKFTFNLLKCNSSSGISWLEIEGFADPLTLSFNPGTFSYTQNLVGEVLCKIFASKEKEIGNFTFDYVKKLAKIPAEQISRLNSFDLFLNYKNEFVDCSFCLNLELSAKDRVRVLQQKLKEMMGIIEKFRIDGLGISLRKEFKTSCCDCAIF
ncbi:hypothetical protein SteCoe_7219 [Stentor coeruleus]|uniref:Uncharacterized protein n=1 Tax=Stentor coeruleus TaxID=5963 RepID=A0A1R2CN17_9CILI|nr:hypothetical protein SteCoe_7219 [Stentor coeruleus]